MHRSIRRVFLSVIHLMLLVLPLTPSVASAQQASRAGLVVVFGPAKVLTTCVSFGEPQLLGSELLRRAGLRVVSASTAGVGDSICKINEVGCNYPGEHCFCQCLGSPCYYWNYWYLQNGQWVYSGRGAGNRTVRNGDVDAWVWGDGSSSPPTVDPAALCGMVGAPLATATSVPATRTRAPVSVTALLPSATPTATATATAATTATATALRSPAPTVDNGAALATAISATPSAPPSATPTPTQAVPSVTLTDPPPTASASPMPTAAHPSGSTTGGYVAFGVLSAALLGAVLYAAVRKRGAMA